MLGDHVSLFFFSHEMILEKWLGDAKEPGDIWIAESAKGPLGHPSQLPPLAFAFQAHSCDLLKSHGLQKEAGVHVHTIKTSP